jgi:ribokinase
LDEAVTSSGPATGTRPGAAPSVVVVGAYLLDCLVGTSRLPQWGDDLRATSMRTAPGGKALNLAVTLARTGARVTAVGADAVGTALLDVLRREGVEVGLIARHPTASTPVCVVLIGDDGRNAFVWRVPDELALTGEILGQADGQIRRADAVVVTLEAAEPVAHVAAVARAAGTLVAVNPAPLPAGPSVFAAVPWDLVDLVVPNEAEARALLPAGHRGRVGPAEDLAAAVGETLRVPQVCVTLGGNGCVLWAGERSHAYPAHPARAVDPTGASDTFLGVYLARHLAGASQADAVDQAQAAAALTVSRPGSFDALPTAAELRLPR